MATIDQVQQNLEARRAAAERRAAAADYDMRRALDLAKAEGREYFTTGQQSRMDSLMQVRSTARQEVSELDRHLEQCSLARADEADQIARSRATYPTGAVITGRADARFTVSRERKTYQPDTDRDGKQFLMDVARNFLSRDPGASERLARHVHEDEVDRPHLSVRASGTGNFAGLVVPQYLTDMYAPLARPMRPFADICNHHDLPPEGMTVNIPLLTTGQTVTLQTSENVGPSGGSPNDTLLTENVQTSTGNTQISRQAIDRGTGIDEVIMQDLFRALASNVDLTLISQATTGLSALAANGAGALTVTPTVPLVYSKILGAANAVEAALLGLARPNYVLMYPYRYYWLAAQMGSTWPTLNTAGQNLPWQAGLADMSKAYDTGPRGFLPSGLDLIVDANLPINLGASANNDAIYVVAGDECHLWEDPSAPVYIRAEQPAAASLGVLMVIYEYYAYSFRRYSGIVQSVIGTGSGQLLAPTF